MESRANLKGNLSSSRNPFPSQNGFNLLLNDGLHKRIPNQDRLALNLSSHPCSFHDSSDQFQDSRNVQESNTSNPSELNASKNDTVVQERQQIPLLNLFPQTPDDSLPKESRNSRLAASRGSKIRKPSIKGRWTQEEDRKLTELVEKYGSKKWTGIANMIGGRLGKQCRERWENHLRDDLKKKFWTEEEEMKVIEIHKEVGSRWAEMARRVPGRSQNTIKNLWNATKRKVQSALRKGRTSSREFTRLERYIMSTLITTNGLPVNATQVDCQLSSLELNSEPETSNQMMMMRRSSSSNREEANSAGGETTMEEEHEDELFGSNGKAGRPDQPGMSEDAQKEKDFMELLLDS